jgi:nucleotide-binding universal stress UspA family protein
MYKHILVPTDGSRLAAKGIRAGVGLAKALGAKVTGVFVFESFVPPMYSEGGVFLRQGLSSRGHKQLAEKAAKKALGVVERAARAAGVRYDTRRVTDERPWQAILQVARARRCDAIVMASHGRGSVRSLILGSETSRVLAHSKIPVMVAR